MRIEWADSARLDFDKAMAFLSEQSPAAARRIGDRVLAAVSLLEQVPEAASKSRHRDLRQLVVARTPDLVIYRIQGDRVEIRAVVHASQRRRR